MDFEGVTRVGKVRNKTEDFYNVTEQSSITFDEKLAKNKTEERKNSDRELFMKTDAPTNNHTTPVENGTTDVNIYEDLKKSTVSNNLTDDLEVNKTNKIEISTISQNTLRPASYSILDEKKNTTYTPPHALVKTTDFDATTFYHKIYLNHTSMNDRKYWKATTQLNQNRAVLEAYESTTSEFIQTALYKNATMHNSTNRKVAMHIKTEENVITYNSTDTKVIVRNDTEKNVTTHNNADKDVTMHHSSEKNAIMHSSMDTTVSMHKSIEKNVTIYNSTDKNVIVLNGTEKNVTTPNGIGKNITMHNSTDKNIVINNNKEMNVTMHKITTNNVNIHNSSDNTATTQKSTNMNATKSVIYITTNFTNMIQNEIINLDSKIEKSTHPYFVYSTTPINLKKITDNASTDSNKKQLKNASYDGIRTETTLKEKLKFPTSTSNSTIIDSSIIIDDTPLDVDHSIKLDPILVPNNFSVKNNWLCGDNNCKNGATCVQKGRLN